MTQRKRRWQEVVTQRKSIFQAHDLKNDLCATARHISTHAPAHSHLCPYPLHNPQGAVVAASTKQSRGRFCS